MPTSTFILAAVVAVTLGSREEVKPAGGSVAEFAGRLEGDGARLELREMEHALAGMVEFQGRLHPLKAGSQATGSLSDDARGTIDLVIGRAGDGLASSTGGTRRELARAMAAASPLAGAGSSRAESAPVASPRVAGATQPTPTRRAAAPGPSPTPASRSAAAFSGAFQGEIAGTPATLELTQHGSSLRGSIDARGYRYRVEATLQGADLARGQLVDLQAGARADLEMHLRGGTVVMTVRTGEQSLDLQFRRGSGTRAASPPAAGAAERDPRLVGRWTRQNIISSGDSHVTTVMFMNVRGDGTFTQGTSGAIAGGSDWGIEQGGDEGRSGRWRSKDSVLYVHHEGAWQPSCRYYIEGTTMMLTFSDGSRELWYRQ